jgi:hypothetical protein
MRDRRDDPARGRWCAVLISAKGARQRSEPFSSYSHQPSRPVKGPVLNEGSPPGTPSLHEASLASYSGDLTTKPPALYLKYETRFRETGFVPCRILELGVHKGESTKVLSTAYPDAEIVSVDLVLHDDVDFSAYPNVRYVQGDQADPAGLDALVRRHFPQSVDLVIDDASHIGYLSKLSFDAVFPHVRSGGIYVVEDWGTGYWDTWPDGSHLQDFPVAAADGFFPKRLPSHDFGMVGFVKSLVDLSAASLNVSYGAPPIRRQLIERLEIWGGLCFVHKA